MKYWFLATIVVASCLVYATADTCSADDGPVACTACSSGTAAQTLEGLPRVNRNIQSVPKNLGYYTWFTCTAGTCTTVSFDTNDILNAPSDPKHPAHYFQNFAVYAAFAVAMAVISLIIGFTCCSCRYCFCCWPCCNGKAGINERCRPCRGGCCGRRWPTLKTKCCGFVQNTATGSYEYPKWQIWATRLYMFSFVFCILLFIGLGYFQGDKALVSSVQSVSESPAGFVNTIRLASTPMSNLLINTLSNPVSTAMKQLNTTLIQAFEPITLVNNVGCIIDSTQYFPDVTILSSFLFNTTSIIASVITTMTQVPAALSSTSMTQNQFIVGLDALNDNITALSTMLTTTKTQLTTVSSQLSTIDSTINTIKSNTDGIPSLTNDITALQSPTTTQITDVTTGATGTIAQVQSGTPSASDLTTLITRITTLNTSFTAQPNLQTTASHMTLFNTRIQNFRESSTISSLVTSIKNLQTQANSANTLIISINNTVNSLINQANTFSLTTIKSMIQSVNTSLNALPSFTILTTELNKITTLKNYVLPCIDGIVDILSSVNKTLVKLPADVDSVINLSHNLNSTIDKAMSSVNSVNSLIDTFDNKRKSFTIDIYYQQIVDGEASYKSTVAAFSSQTYISDLANLLSKFTLDYTLLTELDTLNTTLYSSTIPTSTITAVSSLESYRVTARDFNAQILTDMTMYSKGYCSNSATTVCSGNSDCSGGGTCTGIGTRKCKNDLTQTCNHADSDCTGIGAYCLTDSTRLTAYVTALNAFDSNRPSTSSVTTLLNDVNTKLSIGVSSFTTQVNSLTTTINAVDPSAFSNSINSARSAVNSFDVSTRGADLSSMNNTLISIDLTSAKSFVDSFAISMNDVTKQIQSIQDVKSLLALIRDLLYTKFPSYLSRLSLSSLTTLYNNNNKDISILVYELASIVDDAVEFVNASTTFVKISSKPDLLNTTRDIRERLSLYSSQQNYDKGYLYYLVKVFNPGTVVDSPGPDDRVMETSAGVKYGSGMYCLHRNCIKNTINYYNDKPINEIMPSIPLSLSREQVQALPYIAPLLAALFGLAALLSFCSYKSASWTSSITACCSITQMILIFLIAGIFWPTTLLFHDGCRGMENIGYQQFSGRGNKLCSDLGGIGTATACSFSQGSIGLNVTVNLLDSYKAVLGSCDNSFTPVSSVSSSSSISGHEVIDNIWTTLGDALYKLPQDKSNSFITDLEDQSKTIALRPALTNIIRNATVNVGAVASTFADDLSGILSCSNLNSNYLSIKNSFCCDVASAYYWVMASWYLIAWAMFCCGWPAAILGRKRLANQTWGPEFRGLSEGGGVGVDHEAVRKPSFEVHQNELFTNGAEPSAPEIEAVSYGPDHARNSYQPEGGMYGPPSGNQYGPGSHVPRTMYNPGFTQPTMMPMDVNQSRNQSRSVGTHTNVELTHVPGQVYAR